MAKRTAAMLPVPPLLPESESPVPEFSGVLIEVYQGELFEDTWKSTN